MSTNPGMRALVHALQLWLDGREEAVPGAGASPEPDHAVTELLGMLSAPPPATSPPVIAFDEFDIEHEIGRGGMGIVYAATQRRLGRRVALKVLHQGFASNPNALRRFRREAQTLARLDHPGIVRVLDVGEDHGRHWLAMEIVEGDSLAQQLDRVRSDGGYSGDRRRRLLECIATVAQALHHAHAAGVVHRDVKPSNVLLRADGSAVVGDFGLARDEHDMTMTQAGVVAGTPYYMAPEQIAGRSAECDARSDVFSLGATLYECLTLRHPFDGPTADVVMHRILTSDPPDPRRWQRGLPAELAAITLKALEKDPVRRYATALAFAEDLRAFLDLRPVQARPLSRTRRLLRLVRREPLRAALVTVALLAAAIGGVFLARLPDFRAGERARIERDYEDSLTSGLLARLRRDRGSAFAALDRAQAQFPDRSEAIALRCLCVRDFDGADAALAELDRCAPSSAADPDLLWIRVHVLRRCGRATESAQLAQSLGEPRSGTALWITGLLGTDDPSATPAERAKALARVSLACRIAPNPRLWLHLQWAACARSARDDGAQRESAEALCRLWCDNPAALHYAAANLQDLEPARAVELQQRTLELGYDDPNGWRNLSAYLRKAGRGSDWIAPMRRHLQLHPDDALRDAFIDALARADEYAEVAIEVKAWLREAPDHPSALRQAGLLADLRGDTERAHALLSRVAAMRPNDVEAHYDLAVVSRAGSDEECARHLARVLELDPVHERGHARLLTMLESRGDRDGMRAELERWLSLRAADRDAWLQLAQVLIGAGDPALRHNALLALQRADALSGGTDAEVLAAEAELLDAMDCGPAAAACRERARAAAGPGAAGGKAR